MIKVPQFCAPHNILKNGIISRVCGVSGAGNIENHIIVRNLLLRLILKWSHNPISRRDLSPLYGTGTGVLIQIFDRNVFLGSWLTAFKTQTEDHWLAHRQVVGNFRGVSSKTQECSSFNLKSDLQGLLRPGRGREHIQDFGLNHIPSIQFQAERRHTLCCPIMC